MSSVPNHISAVLQGLRFQDASAEALQKLSEQEWKKLLYSWDVLCLMIPLRLSCNEYLPEWVRCHIDRNIEDNTQRLARIQTTYAEIAEALRYANVEHLVLKGFSQWPGFCEHPRFRFQGDIDIYCPPEFIVPARDALSALGYKSLSGVNYSLADHLPTMIRPSSWHWSGNFYDPEMPVSLELHFSLWNRNTLRIEAPGVEDFWSRRIEGQLDGISFPTLSSEDKLHYSALHFLRDILQGALVTSKAYELARFLHLNADNEEFWRKWRGCHAGAQPLPAVSFAVANQWFGCRLAEQCESVVHDLPNRTQQWVKQFGDAPLRALSRTNKDSVWLHWSLIDSIPDRTAILRRRLLPLRLPDGKRAEALRTAKSQSAPRGFLLHPHIQYGMYCASRLVHHFCLIPVTLLNGLRLWWSSKGIAGGFWPFLATAFFFEIGLYIFFFLYNLLLLDRGLKENFLGYVSSAMSIGSIAGSLIGGVAAQRLGLRRTIHLCLALVSVIAAMRAVCTSPTLLLVLAFFAGCVTTFWAVSLSPAIAELTNERSRPFAFSIVFSSGVGVGILGGQLGGRLPGWIATVLHVPSAANAKELAILMGCGIVALGNWPASRLKFTSTAISRPGFVVRNSFLLRFLPVIAVWSLVAGAFVPFFNVYCVQYLHMSVAQIGSVFSASHVVQVMAMLAAPFLFRRLGLVAGIIYSQIATALALAWLASSQSAPVAAASYLVFSSFLWMSEPGLFSLLMDGVSAAERSQASALNFLISSSSQAVAAAVSGALFLRFGYPPVICAVAGIALVSALLFERVLGNPRRISAASTINSEPSRPAQN